jgi:hypothetical protein
MIRALLLATSLALAGCAGAAPPSAPTAAQQQPVAVAVVRDGDSWTAEYRFPRSAPAWAFIRSANAEATGQSWRASSWTVETPGVRLERIGRYDALVADRGNVPTVVRVRFMPFTDEVRADYVPALALGGGATALFDDHFLVFSAARNVVEGLPVDFSGHPIEDSGTRVTFRDTAGPLLHRGRRAPEVTTQNSNSYILFGARDPIVTEAMAAVIDPALPGWLADSLRELTPAILSLYAAELGPAPGGPPTLLASWVGPTPGRSSMNGGVVPGTMVMRFEGDGVVERNAELLNLARWFIAHEGSHFWLGQAVRYERSRDAWMLEGGADLLAIRTVQALDPAYDWKGELNRALRDCAALTENRGVASAEDRGEHRAYYACGAVFALIAEAKSGRPYSAFVRGLVDANREDGVLTRAEWLDAFDGVAREPSIRADIETLLDRGAPQPKTVLASLLRRAGIPHAVGEDGLPRLQ